MKKYDLPNELIMKKVKFFFFFLNDIKKIYF
jgi:hypothetical protein